jgi:hypothetical protein
MFVQSYKIISSDAYNLLRDKRNQKVRYYIHLDTNLR